MDTIRRVIDRIDAFEGLDFSGSVLKNVAWQQIKTLSRIDFYVPGFIQYETSEIGMCSQNQWPAFSITGGECKLQCDHCKARILEPMVAAQTPEKLIEKALISIEQGAKGILLTGGSNHLNEVDYSSYYSAIRKIKDQYPEFSIVAHTALVNSDMAVSLEQAGVDVAMMDVIGSQDTISQVYHLKRTVDDFQDSLQSLRKTTMKVVPHIVLGLHYGNFLGEWHALEMVRTVGADALVLVVVNPAYTSKTRPFRKISPETVGKFFLHARRVMDDMPLLLGCARPHGADRRIIDAYAVMAGLNGVAHPSEGVVQLAKLLGREVEVHHSCCSMVAGEMLNDQCVNMRGSGFKQAGIQVKDLLAR